MTEKEAKLQLATLERVKALEQRVTELEAFARLAASIAQKHGIQ